MQFTIFIRPNQTTTHQTGLLKGYLGDDLSDNIRKEMLWAITTIGMQDLPFVVARTYILFRHATFSPTNVFYLFKNSCIIVILVYRVAVVKSESHRRERTRIEELVRARAVLCRMRHKDRVHIVWDMDMRRKSIKQLSDMMPVKSSSQTTNEDDSEDDNNDTSESSDEEKKVT
ncbi:uncharacterized protein LOC112556287 [Pomacea canaliculata]|uniref:uncharacterized protein LOC112556287 n=1 Tax=Pomacea canaliculata TaxID=400727 RepID=UPI000D731145|nr:uncharacterized protein LOC112556287 [Pomacea canaliculata]